MESLELEVPNSVLGEAQGFALDFGATRIKVAYKSRNQSTAEQTKLFYRDFPAENVNECVTFLKENALLDPKLPNGVINVTGIKVSKETEKIFQEEFGVRLDIVFETASFVGAFLFLVNNFPKEVVVLPRPERGYREGLSLAEQTIRLALAVGNSSAATTEDGCENGRATNGTVRPPSSAVEERNTEPYSEADPDLFPCLLVGIGTSGSFKMVDDNGSTFRTVEVVDRGGGYLMAMASLLVDVKSYDQLMQLAEQGDAHNVSSFTKCYRAGDYSNLGDYACTPDDFPLCSFGKVAFNNRAEFQREDLARGLVCCFARSHAKLIHWIAWANHCRRIYLGGGVYKHSLMREETMKNFMHNVVLRTMAEKSSPEMHFLRYGSYMPVMGALLENVQHLGGDI